MPLADRFDRLIARARDLADPERRIDLCLGALLGLPEWHFWNRGEPERPAPALAELADGARQLLVFTSPGKLYEAAEAESAGAVSCLTVPIHGAPAFALAFEQAGIGGILVNPGEYAFAVPMPVLRRFVEAHAQGLGKDLPRSGWWRERSSTEEDDFWDELGID